MSGFRIAHHRTRPEDEHRQPLGERLNIALGLPFGPVVGVEEGYSVREQIFTNGIFGGAVDVCGADIRNGLQDAMVLTLQSQLQDIRRTSAVDEPGLSQRESKAGRGRGVDDVRNRLAEPAIHCVFQIKAVGRDVSRKYFQTGVGWVENVPVRVCLQYTQSAPTSVSVG